MGGETTHPYASSTAAGLPIQTLLWPEPERPKTAYPSCEQCLIGGVLGGGLRSWPYQPSERKAPGTSSNQYPVGEE